MPTLRNYKIFISHAWDYNADYYQLKVAQRNTLTYLTNLSVLKKHNPILNNEELTKELNNQMRPAEVFLILAGMYVSHSDWIDYEINFARRIGRRL